MEKKNFPEKGNQPLSNRALAPLLTRACGGLLWKENDTEFKSGNFRACRRSFASWPPGGWRALTRISPLCATTGNLNCHVAITNAFELAFAFLPSVAEAVNSMGRCGGARMCTSVPWDINRNMVRHQGKMR